MENCPTKELSDVPQSSGNYVPNLYMYTLCSGKCTPAVLLCLSGVRPHHNTSKMPTDCMFAGRTELSGRRMNMSDCGRRASSSFLSPHKSKSCVL